MQLIALYTVGAWCGMRAAVAGLLAVHNAKGVLAVLRVPFFESPLALVTVLAMTVAWAFGRGMRRHRRARERAAVLAAEAEAARAASAERAVLGERVRIARDLHDVVSHTLTGIAVQSAVARHQLGTCPEADHPAGAALVAIEEASRTALDDLRRMLGALDTDGTSGNNSGAVLRPAPGLAELRLLASAHRAAHGPVELTVDPVVESTPDSLRLTVYRLVQEALTNVRKHAPAAATRVLIEADRQTWWCRSTTGRAVRPVVPADTGWPGA